MHDEQVRPKLGPNAKPGRPKEPGSLRGVADQLGLSKSTIHRARQHVAVAERYPFLQRKWWKQAQALEAARLLDAMPEEERTRWADALDKPGIVPGDALAVLRSRHTPKAPRAR